jgi:hypothetical protein
MGITLTGFLLRLILKAKGGTFDSLTVIQRSSLIYFENYGAAFLQAGWLI